MTAQWKAALTLSCLVTIIGLILLSDKGIIPEIVGTIVKWILLGAFISASCIFIWFATVEFFKSGR
jgi:hypothetical protein